jgi:hypothetical protein
MEYHSKQKAILGGLLFATSLKIQLSIRSIHEQQDAVMNLHSLQPYKHKKVSEKHNKFNTY